MAPIAPLIIAPMIEALLGIQLDTLALGMMIGAAIALFAIRLRD